MKTIHFKTFENEDHTLGGLLQYQLLENDQLTFVGFKRTDPQAKCIELKMMTTKPCTTEQSDMIVKSALRELLTKVETMETNFQNALYKFENK